MKKVFVLSFLLILGAFLCGGALAGPFTATITGDYYPIKKGDVPTGNNIPTANYDNDGPPDIYRAYNLFSGGTIFTNNAELDPFFVYTDDIWETLSENDGTMVAISLSAGYDNIFGFYDDVGVGSDKTPLYTDDNGKSDFRILDPFPTATFDPEGTFGFYLEVPHDNETYYSEPGLNPDLLDHLMTFSISGTYAFNVSGSNDTSVVVTLTDPYLLAWEDLPFRNEKLGDEDYDDMIVLVGNVKPVPEPTTFLLLGGGLLGLAAMRRKKG